MRIVSGSLTLDATDKDVLTLARPDIGKIIRLGLRNPTTSDITITIQDRFTPDPSAKVASPTAVTKDRYSTLIIAGRAADIDGNPICKIINNFRVASSVTGVILSYTMVIE